MASGVATMVVNTAVLAVGYPIYLHFLGYEKYGLWLVLSVVLTFAQLGNLGIGPAVVKLVAEDHARGDIHGVQRYVTTALAILCLSGLVVLSLILLFKASIIDAFKLNADDAKLISSLILYVGILSIYVLNVQVLDAALSGLGRMDLANYIQAIARVISIAAATSLLCLGYGVVSLLIGNMLSYLANHLLAIIFIRRIAPVRLLRGGNLDVRYGKRLMSFGGTVFASSLLNMLFNPFNKLMLSRYVGVASIPVYEIAFTGSMYVRNLIEAALRPLMPEISRLNGSTDERAAEKIRRLYGRSIGLILLAGTPIYLILLVFAPVLLQLWLRERFTEALPWALRIMLVGTFLSLLAVPAYWTLMGKGCIWRNLGAFFVQSMMNLVGVALIVIVSQVTIHTVVLAAAGAMAAMSLYLFIQMKRVFALASDAHPARASTKAMAEGISSERRSLPPTTVGVRYGHTA